ncbi:MAG: hypothetical protein WCT20_03145, partial [Candidatus Babeliales bacterium]
AKDLSGQALENLVDNKIVDQRLIADIASAKQKVKDAKKEHEKASQAHEANPSDKTQAALEQASKNWGMAERFERMNIGREARAAIMREEKEKVRASIAKKRQIGGALVGTAVAGALAGSIYGIVGAIQGNQPNTSQLQPSASASNDDDASAVVGAVEENAD